MNTLPNIEKQRTTRIVLAIVAAWGLAVIAGAESGLFRALYAVQLIGPVIAVSIIIPMIVYFSSRRFQAYADAVGHRPIVLLHIWRIPAALLFFWYGFQGTLPPLFWIPAGVGDFIAGSYAAYLTFKPGGTRRYLSFHRFGFADFAVAVGTGIYCSLANDPRMAPIAVLPLALVPLFGVGISGITHLIAFDMLRRGTGSNSARIGATPIAA
jgi:hypothetical protein